MDGLRSSAKARFIFFVWGSFSPSIYTRPLYFLGPLSTARNAIQWSGRTSWSGEGLVGLVRWPSRGMGQDVSRKASGLFDRHNLSKFLAPAADLLCKLMSLETLKLLYAQSAMIIYRIILD